MHPSCSPLTVPPGFRFHPTDEELLYYYLRKKVAYEPIDLDVIREIDLNKLEPWDLKDRCKIGTGPQDEWYFFSHKDKKYPTGTRTNRATMAGFWKATGRDKAIFLGNAGRKIGLRKTLVFYTGRAPHGKKTDWIMHEYRLDDDNAEVPITEDGWVVCRVFKKKSIIQRGFDQQGTVAAGDDDELHYSFQHSPGGAATPVDQKHGIRQLMNGGFPAFDPSMHLPHLTSAEAAPLSVPVFMSGTPAAATVNPLDISDMPPLNGGDRFGAAAAAADWSILDKLLASHQNLDQLFHGKFGGAAAVGVPHHYQQQQQMMGMSASSLQRLPLQYLGCDTADLLKFSM
ncbi:unnamed protein product [Urochloa decumbens]|uniref:NAC domain-containing protein n=1 Tax=Urochloa decumbens TaxID=240449 RepID=A0ABC9CMK5_9POAL